MAININKTKLGSLDVSQTALFMCDFQEKFRPAMQMFDEILENTVKLIHGCKLMEVPLIVTEQYPKGLGPTVPGLPIDHAKCIVPKTQFSMLLPEVREVMDQWQGNLQSIILCGMETHVCIEQTAIDLLAEGYTVHIVANCVTSRSQEDRLLALQRLQNIGCFITTVETVLFNLLADKEHSKFKEVASLVRNLAKSTNIFPTSNL